MRFRNPRLDRIWLWAIGLSFALMAPIGIALSYQRHPMFGIAQAVLIGIALWHWTTAQASTPQSD